MRRCSRTVSALIRYIYFNLKCKTTHSDALLLDISSNVIILMNFTQVYWFLHTWNHSLLDRAERSCTGGARKMEKIDPKLQ